MATVGLNWSVELGVVLCYSVEHDNELTKETTENTNALFAFLAPTVDLCDLLLENLLNRRYFADE